MLFVLSSPSGAGKTTLTHMLEKRFSELTFSVSHTTRPRRSNEVDGVDYHFVDRAEFERLVRAEAFLEWAEVHGNLYGTASSEIIRAEQTPNCVGIIFDIDYQGARQIRAKISGVVGVFILPPSMEELERRLRGRASETEESLKRRFAAAKLEIEQYALFDYLVVNDDLNRAFHCLESVIIAERVKRRRCAALAEQLLRVGRLP